MKKIALVLFALAFGISEALAGTPEKLPGRRVDRRDLPDTISVFLSARFGQRHFTFRRDKESYYAYLDDTQYILFSQQGAILGYSFLMMQPSTHELRACIPESIASYLRERFPGCKVDIFLPAGEGFRARIFGTENKILYFDSSGTPLREEMPGE